MRAEARRRGLEVEVDSAGTGNWHAGEPPDPRAIAVAARHGVDISGLRARQVRPDDFRRSTHLIALDGDNLRNLRRLAPADATAGLSLLLDHAPGRRGQAVADPWFGDAAGFETPWADVNAGVAGLIDTLSHWERA